MIFFYAVVIAVKVVRRSSLQHGALHLICFDLLGALQSSALICRCRIESCGAATICNRNSSSSPRKKPFCLSIARIQVAPAATQFQPISFESIYYVFKKWNDFFRLFEIPNLTHVPNNMKSPKNAAIYQRSMAKP